ncbi:hypothetical protein BGW80DRAFT_1249810 [Lactifluus volemus]|nr:hypothetical protein BGW80DRAFT_1249810 [Lactifluus volemus]
MGWTARITVTGQNVDEMNNRRVDEQSAEVHMQQEDNNGSKETGRGQVCVPLPVPHKNPNPSLGVKQRVKVESGDLISPISYINKIIDGVASIIPEKQVDFQVITFVDLVEFYDPPLQWSQQQLGTWVKFHVDSDGEQGR